MYTIYCYFSNLIGNSSPEQFLMLQANTLNEVLVFLKKNTREMEVINDDNINLKVLHEFFEERDFIDLRATRKLTVYRIYKFKIKPVQEKGMR